MDSEAYQYAELIALLKEQGHAEPEIAAIMDRIKAYEENVGRDMLMESLANGSMSLEQLLQEAEQERQ